jgi:glucosamine--fructose-6-phosphate aminotransferase (isomerizing)
VSSLIDLDIAEQPAVLARVVDGNAAAVAQVEAMVGRARSVRMLAIGSSRHAAGYGSTAIAHLTGVPSAVLAAPGANAPLPPLSPDDVVISVSQSGDTPALVDAAVEARAQGAALVAVTNTASSALEAVADVTLHCRAGRERVVAATKSVTSAMLLLRAAAGPLAPAAAEQLRAAVASAIALDLDAMAAAPAPSFIICGGLTGGWVADETALKFAEVAGVAVAADSLIEFLHGPVAAPGAVLALVDPDDPNVPALIRRHDVTLVHPPRAGDWSLNAIIDVVVGQRLAVAWARVLDRDPDASRGLEKVTRSR